MLKLVAYFVFALCLNSVCSTNVTESVQRSYVRHNSQSHHHNHQLIQQRSNPNTRTKNHIDFYYGDSVSRPWIDSSHSIPDGHSRRNANKTHSERVPSVNTKLQPITSKSLASKRVTDPLKLTLIQTNGHSFVANHYPDSFSTHFYRWPIASQSPSTDYNIKWRTANNPFASHFNPTVESVGSISTVASLPTIATTTMTTTTAAAAPTSSSTSMPVPTANVHRLYTDHRMHSKHHTGHGRHVCVDYKSIITPPIQQHRQMPCRDANLCEKTRVNYDIFNARRIGHTIYNCCPGWTKISKHSHGCTKPICKIPCKNNGKCVKPEQCSCPAGYTGRHCEHDVNECETEKPCDQMCHNTDGSFYCTCRLGFILGSDRQSCKKIDSSFGNDDSNTAFEARDLENDVDNDELATRINSIEQLIITEKERNVETNKLVHHTLNAVNNLKHRLDSLESRQHELNYLRDKLKSFESQTNKLQYVVDVLSNAVINH